MSQLINYDTNGNVMYYHTMPSDTGTANFEHKNMISLTNVPDGKKPDGSDDPNVLMPACPVCGETSGIPLLGGEEAQRLHAHVRFARRLYLTYLDAVQAVISDVEAAGGVPRLDPTVG